jgi:hypothetical protein
MTYKELSMSRRLAFLTALLVAAGPAGADVVTDWNNAALDSIRAQRTNPPVATRQLAIVHTAIFDAVNGLDRRFEPYHVAALGPAGASVEAAAAAAGHRALSAIYPGRTSIFDALLAQQLAAVADGQAEDDGVAWGRSVADAILALRANDGSATAVAYQAPLGANWWVRTPPAFAPPLLPQWPFVTPWTMTSGSQFRTPGPPILTDPAYVAAWLEVYLLGRADSTVRTADQSEIAEFWNDGVGTQTPPGHWNEIAQTLAAQQGNTLIDNARLFALLTLTVADAAVVSWDNKYFYGHWRPHTGIVNADLDGNPATFRDPSWFNFITTPPFPSYTSGHSTFSGSSARILGRFFGRDDLTFSAVSDGSPGAVRDFTSLTQAAEEAGQSRIYGGIHWQYENRDALASGRALADYVFFNFLRPVGVGPQPCVPSDTRLCLLGGRFAAEVDWHTSPSATGEGHALAITDVSGSFWFFDDDNAELLVKVLDACNGTGHFWVLAGGATNVEYVLRVTDTQSATTRTYFNPLNHMAEAVLDTTAFATCP